MKAASAGEPSEEVTAHPRRAEPRANLRGFQFHRGRNPWHLAAICLEKERATRMEAALVPGSLAAYRARTGQRALHRWPPT